MATEDNSQEPTWTSRTRAEIRKKMKRYQPLAGSPDHLSALTPRLDGCAIPFGKTRVKNLPCTSQILSRSKWEHRAGGRQKLAGRACMGVGKCAACNLGLLRSLSSLPGGRPRTTPGPKQAAPRAAFPTRGSRLPSYRVFWHP